MFDGIQEVLAAIETAQVKEHTHPNIELKASWMQKHGSKLSALCNKIESLPAWLLVGVNDDGSLAGKDAKWAKQTEEILSQHINDNMDPVQACFRVSAHPINGSWIIVVGVRNPGEVVYWGSAAYTKAGTTIREMEPHEVLELRIKLPGLTDYTRQQVQADCDPDLISAFVSRLYEAERWEGTCSHDLALTRLGIANTQTARILFGECCFRIVKYDKFGEPISNSTQKGLYRLLTNEFLDEVQQWNPSQPSKQSRHYPEKALRETLANAVAHAAYFENDGEVIVELRPTALVVSNLCFNESTYFANRWFSRAHKTVNGLLMETLRLGRHVDELGRGKNLIFAESIKTGKKPPSVSIQRAGKCSRWMLTLHGGTTNRVQLRLLNRIREFYNDEQRALIAHSLVLWREKPVTEIRNYIDDTVSEEFADVLASLDGPIYYYAPDDKITLNRWARLLLEEGKDSKKLSPREERSLLEFVRKMCLQYEDGYVTPKELRRLTHMAETASERTLSSKLLRKWSEAGYVRKVQQGKYRFIPVEVQSSGNIKNALLRALTSLRPEAENATAEQKDAPNSVALRG